MIYTAPDYLLKYSDTLSEIIVLAKLDEYSDDYIEQSISRSYMIKSFENSDVTEIAFSTTMKCYRDIFKDSRAFVDDIPLFTPYYWIGEMYCHLFLKYHLTFETIFTYFPLKLMEKQYYLYHEMGLFQFDEYAKKILQESPLSIHMKKRKINCLELSSLSGVSLSTLRALKSKKRDIKKLNIEALEKIAITLKTDVRSLLDHITLIFDKPYVI